MVIEEPSPDSATAASSIGPPRGVPEVLWVHRGRGGQEEFFTSSQGQASFDPQHRGFFLAKRSDPCGVKFH